MKTLIVSFAVLGICTGFAFTPDKDCDNKTVEKAKYCGDCKAICDDKCPLDEKGNCKACRKAPKEVEICVKVAYECSGCKKLGPDEKGCCKGADLAKKRVIKALIVFKCSGCGASADKEGDCAKEECKKAGKKVKRTCDKNGTWPHGGEAPKEK